MSLCIHHRRSEIIDMQIYRVVELVCFERGLGLLAGPYEGYGYMPEQVPYFVVGNFDADFYYVRS